MMREKVVVIIPTYNEAQCIEETICAVFKATQTSTAFDIHVLVFDSHSTDNTQALITNLQTTYPHLYLKTEPKKTGLGSAYFQAMHHALDALSADIIIEFDADLSHQPEYILPMLDALKEHDVVLGSRYIAGGCIPSDWAWHRKLLSVAGNYIARLMLTSKYKDFTSGFRITRAHALIKSLPTGFISSQYAYKLELLWRLHKNRCVIKEYPIAFIDRKKGQSKLPSNSILDALNVLTRLRLTQMKQYTNMCLIGLLGFGIQFIVYNSLRLQISPFYAAQFAVIIAILSNFTFNNQLNFKKRQPKVAKEKVRSLTLFFMYSIINVGLQSAWLSFWIKHFGTGFIKENMIITSGLILLSIMNYVVYTTVIWQDKSTVRV